MSGKRYMEKFETAAVKQVAERGQPASEVTTRPGQASIACTRRQSATACLKRSARWWILRQRKCGV